MVSFVLDGYIINEDAGAVSMCVDSGVTEGFEADLTVSLSAADGTACEALVCCIASIWQLSLQQLCKKTQVSLTQSSH